MQVHTVSRPSPTAISTSATARRYHRLGSAEKFGGICNLRMDDTNPAKEDTEYVDAIQEDIHWLGFDWGDRFFYGSDYFEKTYELAVGLIKKGLAYVCELTPSSSGEYRGDVTTPPAPWRDRPIEESLDLFERMKNGEFPEGRYTPAGQDRPGERQLQHAGPGALPHPLHRAPPPGHQVVHLPHVRLRPPHPGCPWRASPTPCAPWSMRLTAPVRLGHPKHRRPQQAPADRVCPPGHQLTVMSKRKLRKLVEEDYVSGWDDPRMPTLCGLADGAIPPRLHPQFLRPHRRGEGHLHRGVCLFGTLPAGGSERACPAGHGGAPSHQADHHKLPRGSGRDPGGGEQPQRSRRRHPHSLLLRHLYLESDDFLETPVPKYKRLFPGGPECRLKGGLPHHLHRLRQGRGGQRGGSAGGVIPLLAETPADGPQG